MCENQSYNSFCKAVKLMEEKAQQQHLITIMYGS